MAAGLAGITKGYLSMLELGQRGFNRRGACADGRIGRPDPAFTALVQSYIVAGDVANRLAGNVDLSVSAFRTWVRHGLSAWRRWADWFRPVVLGVATDVAYRAWPRIAGAHRRD